jgi:hypothetical protein
LGRLKNLSTRRFVGYFLNQYGEALVFEYDTEQERGWIWGEDLDWAQHEVIDGRVSALILNRHELLWLKACWEAATAFRKEAGNERP